MVTILFFAQLREQLQCEKMHIELSETISLGALRERIINENPTWTTYLANEKLLFAINQTMAKPHQDVNDRDEVAFFPPVTGG